VLIYRYKYNTKISFFSVCPEAYCSTKGTNYQHSVISGFLQSGTAPPCSTPPETETAARIPWPPIRKKRRISSRIVSP
ncbi:hypothetical protein, partial [Alistipes ihumii]|uniref:hypothetical protein n=1 Tax=Alistipes ihumii TaxID=1470347 RepID=UPI003AF937AD